MNTLQPGVYNALPQKTPNKTLSLQLKTASLPVECPHQRHSLKIPTVCTLLCPWTDQDLGSISREAYLVGYAGKRPRKSYHAPLSMLNAGRPVLVKILSIVKYPS
jgi:hypothetical protein